MTASVSTTVGESETIEGPRCPHARAAIRAELNLRSRQTEDAISALITQKNYPCIAALRSFHADEYLVGFYGDLGTGKTWRELRGDLLYFLEEQKKSGSIYLTFWAVFAPSEKDEDEFEKAMWDELSLLTSAEEKNTDWPSSETADPDSKEFRFSLGGTEFFVVGLHSRSSRLGRTFPFPALVFNVFAQFDALDAQGLYGPMVAQNRVRDQKFQGSVNPMVAEHGEKWEAIQFSGRANGSDWKCPFHFVSAAQKP